MNVAGALIQAPLRAVPLATLLLVNHVVPKPVKGVLRFVLLLGQQKVRRLAGSALRLEQLPLMGPVAVVVDILAGPAAVLAFGRPVLRTLAPPVWRMASFYGHMLPLLFGYVLRAHRAIDLLDLRASALHVRHVDLREDVTSTP